MASDGIPASQGSSAENAEFWESMRRVQTLVNLAPQQKFVLDAPEASQQAEPLVIAKIVATTSHEGDNSNETAMGRDQVASFFSLPILLYQSIVQFCGHLSSFAVEAGELSEAVRKFRRERIDSNDIRLICKMAEIQFPLGPLCVNYEIHSLKKSSIKEVAASMYATKSAEFGSCHTQCRVWAPAYRPGYSTPGSIERLKEAMEGKTAFLDGAYKTFSVSFGMAGEMEENGADKRGAMIALQNVRSLSWLKGVGSKTPHKTSRPCLQFPIWRVDSTVFGEALQDALQQRDEKEGRATCFQNLAIRIFTHLRQKLGKHLPSFPTALSTSLGYQPYDFLQHNCFLELQRLLNNTMGIFFHPNMLPLEMMRWIKAHIATGWRVPGESNSIASIAEPSGPWARLMYLSWRASLLQANVPYSGEHLAAQVPHNHKYGEEGEDASSAVTESLLEAWSSGLLLENCVAISNRFDGNHTDGGKFASVRSLYLPMMLNAHYDPDIHKQALGDTSCSIM